MQVECRWERANVAVAGVSCIFRGLRGGRSNVKSLKRVVMQGGCPVHIFAIMCVKPEENC